MTEPAIRPDVVALFVDINPVGPTSQWTHHDGTPVTADELELILSANFDELEAARDYSARAADHHREQVAAVERIGEIAAPYFAQLPKGARMGAVLELASDADRAEITRLMELVAPDGTIVRTVNGQD
jgi:hypothetical protein